MVDGTSCMPRPCAACLKHGAATRIAQAMRAQAHAMPGCRHQTRLLATPGWVAATPAANATRTMSVEVVKQWKLTATVTVAVELVTATMTMTVAVGRGGGRRSGARARFHAGCMSLLALVMAGRRV